MAPEAWIAIASVFISLATVFYTGMGLRHKVNNTYVETLEKEIEKLKEDLNLCKEELKSCRKNYAELKAENFDLMRKLIK